MFFFSQAYFYHRKVHIKWDVVISSSLRLLMKVWIWYRCQNRIENYYHHDEEQLGFYKKVHTKTQSMSKKKDVLAILRRKKRMSFNLLDKKKLYSRKLSIASSTWRKLTWRNFNWTGKLQVTRLYFLKEILLAHFQRFFGRSNRDVFLENEGKIHEGGCVKELFSSTCRLVSRNFIKD